MKKKVILIISCIIVIIVGISLYFIRSNHNKKFYLSKEYYGINNFINTNYNEVNSIIKDKKSFILFTYNNFCNLQIPCDSIFEKFAKQNKIGIYSIPFDDFKNTTLYNMVKYAPTVIIVNNGKIVTYLDANKDEDIDKYQDIDEFTNWIKNYILIK